MVYLYFRTKNANFGLFWRAFGWKLLVYIFPRPLVFSLQYWYILLAFGIFAAILV
jgi:hypothetical protein